MTLRIAAPAARQCRSQRLPHGLVRGSRRPARLPEQKSRDHQRPQAAKTRMKQPATGRATNWETPTRPRHLPAGLGHIPRPDQGPVQQRGQPDHLHRPQRRPSLGPPLQAAERDLPGLQRLQRPLALPLQLGRLQNDHRHLARGQGLLRTPLRQRLQRRQLVPQSRLPDGRRGSSARATKSTTPTASRSTPTPASCSTTKRWSSPATTSTGPKTR